MNAMRSLLLRFWPRRKAGAPVMRPAAVTAPPTNSRRVISRCRLLLTHLLIASLLTRLPGADPRILMDPGGEGNPHHRGQGSRVRGFGGTGAGGVASQGAA